LELPFDGPDDDSPLDSALDAVRDRFGGTAVTRAVNLGQDLSPSVPILSD
jgi:DNA polymerase-4